MRPFGCRQSELSGTIFTQGRDARRKRGILERKRRILERKRGILEGERGYFRVRVSVDLHLVFMIKINKEMKTKLDLQNRTMV